MHTRLALHPDLVENALEDRTLLASFLDSTYFQYNFGSGMSLFQNYGGASSLSLTDSGGPLGYGGFDEIGAGAYASNYAAGSSYLGFGSNPFGSGLSPLDGVVAGYSMNTALSNELGDGSSLPGAGSFSDGFNEFIPGGNASLRAGAIGGPVNVTTSPGDLVGPVGYGSSFSSGNNFSLNLLGGKIYGMGQSTIGTLSASASSSASGYGSFEEPSSAPDGAQNQAPNRGRPGEKLLTNPATRVPSRHDQAPPPKKDVAPRPATSTPAQPESASPRRLPPLPASEGREIVPTGPVRQAPEPQKPAAPPTESAPAAPAENPGGLTMLLDAILKVPFFGKP